MARCCSLVLLLCAALVEIHADISFAEFMSRSQLAIELFADRRQLVVDTVVDAPAHNWERGFPTRFIYTYTLQSRGLCRDTPAVALYFNETPLGWQRCSFRRVLDCHETLISTCSVEFPAVLADLLARGAPRTRLRVIFGPAPTHPATGATGPSATGPTGPTVLGQRECPRDAFVLLGDRIERQSETVSATRLFRSLESGRALRAEYWAVASPWFVTSCGGGNNLILGCSRSNGMNATAFHPAQIVSATQLVCDLGAALDDASLPTRCRVDLVIRCDSAEPWQRLGAAVVDAVPGILESRDTFPLHSWHLACHGACGHFSGSLPSGSHVSLLPHISPPATPGAASWSCFGWVAPVSAPVGWALPGHLVSCTCVCDAGVPPATVEVRFDCLVDTLALGSTNTLWIVADQRTGHANTLALDIYRLGGRYSWHRRPEPAPLFAVTVWVRTGCEVLAAVTSIAAAVAFSLRAGPFSPRLGWVNMRLLPRSSLAFACRTRLCLAAVALVGWLWGDMSLAMTSLVWMGTAGTAVAHAFDRDDLLCSTLSLRLLVSVPDAVSALLYGCCFACAGLPQLWFHTDELPPLLTGAVLASYACCSGLASCQFWISQSAVRQLLRSALACARCHAVLMPLALAWPLPVARSCGACQSLIYGVHARRWLGRLECLSDAVPDDLLLTIVAYVGDGPYVHALVGEGH